MFTSSATALRGRTRHRWLALLLSLSLLGAVQGLAASPASASDVGGPISRSEVLARAKFWVDQNIPYNRGAYSPDVDGRTYRQDCSGFVSMAWHLSTSATTQSLAGYGNRLASIDQLQPGDMLLKTGHVVLFVQWNDDRHTSATIWHESKPGVGTVAATLGRDKADEYVPYSYTQIVNDVTTIPTPVMREVHESADNTGWQPMAPGIAGTNLASMTMDGVKYVYTVKNGYVYDAASNTGWQNLNTGIPTSGPLAVMAIDGVKYIYTVTAGYVHEAASSTGWQNLNSGIPTSGPLAVMAIDGVKHVYTIAGGQVYEAASNTGWQNLNTGVAASGTVSAISLAGVKILYTL
jgi:hypothetical protein